MEELISTLLPFLNGLPRCARNDACKLYPCRCEAKLRQYIQERHRRLQAFSLIELLISLIIISLIVAVFTPVLTHRLKRDNIAISQTQKSNLSSECQDIDSECKLCYIKEQKCIMCNKTCLSNQYIDIEPCKCINCSANCLTCNAKTCLKCSDDAALMDDGTCKKCTELYGANCTACNNKKCLSCKTDFKLSNDGKTCISLYVEPSEDNCAKINAIFIPAKYNGAGGKGLCVTKYNAGDAGGAIIPSGVQRVSVDHSIHPGNCQYPWNTAPRCWSGQTACSYSIGGGTCTCSAVGITSSVPFDYGNCYRVLCNYPAATQICANYSVTSNGIIAAEWRLPKKAEFQGWAANVNAITRGIGTKGLQLCDRMAGYGSPVCHHTCTGCNGAGCAYCYPHTIHGSDSRAQLAKGNLSIQDGNGGSDAYSTRCVIDRLKEQK